MSGFYFFGLYILKINHNQKINFIIKCDLKIPSAERNITWNFFPQLE